MTDFRALCARMADELDHYRQLLMDDRRATHALAAEARAALAQPEPQGPTDVRDEALLNAADAYFLYGEGKYTASLEEVIAFAHEMLDEGARWGRPATTGEQQ
jgi:hypothetical protein